MSGSEAVHIEDFILFFRPSRATFPGDATEAETERVAAHFDHLHRAMQKGRLFLAGRSTDESPIGIALLRMESLEEAKAFLAEDPAVRSGVFIGDVHPFRFALMSEFLVAQREMEATNERNRAMSRGA